MTNWHCHHGVRILQAHSLRSSEASSERMLDHVDIVYSILKLLGQTRPSHACLLSQHFLRQLMSRKLTGRVHFATTNNTSATSLSFLNERNRRGEGKSLSGGHGVLLTIRESILISPR